MQWNFIYTQTKFVFFIIWIRGYDIADKMPSTIRGELNLFWCNWIIFLFFFINIFHYYFFFNYFMSNENFKMPPTISNFLHIYFYICTYMYTLFLYKIHTCLNTFFLPFSQAVERRKWTALYKDNLPLVKLSCVCIYSFYHSKSLCIFII